MESTMPEQRTAQWRDQPSTGKTSVSGTEDVNADSKHATMDDAHVVTEQPPKPPPSPPTSPPLAIAKTVFNPTTSGSNDKAVSPNKPLRSGGFRHIATPSARGWFQAFAMNLPSYSFTNVNPLRRVLYLGRRCDSSMHSIRLRKSGVNVVGFDLEWKPMRDGSGEYNKVSLVQVATSNEILLIRLPENSKFPAGLRALLEDPTILKVGAGIQNDVDKLWRDWKVNVTNYLDLAFLARYHDYFWDTCDVLNNQCLEGAFGGTWCNEVEHDSALGEGSDSVTHMPLEHRYGRPVYPTAHPVALARLVARYLGKRLDKECQLSNWAAPLNDDQILYAANDGFSSLDVYNALVRLRDRTPGWVEAQAKFYRMVIESQKSAAMPLPQGVPSPLPQIPPAVLPSAISDEETVFTMDDTNSEDASQHRPSLLQLLKHRQAPVVAPILHRSLSDTHLVKLVGSITANQEANDKLGGSRPLYPSPPVTPTHASLPPASLSSPLALSKSAPSSPLFIARLTVAEPAKLEDANEVAGVQEANTALEQSPRTSDHTPTISSAQPRVDPISRKRSDPKLAPKPSIGVTYKDVQTGHGKSLPEKPPLSMPPTAQNHYPYPTLNSIQAPLVHHPAPSYSVPPANEYFPPTPATPYASHNPYETPVYNSVPVPYPQVAPFAHAAYSYSNAPPYSSGRHAYWPFSDPKSQGYYAPPAVPPSQPYYTWGGIDGNHGWIGQNPVMHQVPPAVGSPPVAPVASAELMKKRPSLRYTPDGWCSVEDPVSTRTATRSKASAAGSGWVSPVPDGIPTPQLDSDIRTPDADWPRRHVKEEIASEEFAGDNLTSAIGDLTVTTNTLPRGQTIFIGDLALHSDLSSENVRFNSFPIGISLGVVTGMDDVDRPLSAPEICA